MATASQFVNGPAHFANKLTDWVNDNIRVALFKSGLTIDATARDAWNFYDDLTAGTNEITGTNYTANGEALTGKSVSVDTASDETRLLASNTTWTNLTATGANAPRYAVVYNRTPASDATRPIHSYVNFGADQSVSGVNFTIDWHDTQGVIKFVASAEA